MQGVFAQSMTPANTSASAKLASNGATVFSIANPNARGLSYNPLTRMDVTASGAVVNNALQQTSTQLAGTIDANKNLQASASTILLDATASNRQSSLAGAVELAGPSAKFVMANPYGISCSGCSFLNFNNTVSLVAGTPQVDSASNLKYVNVQGAISVGGAGLSAGSGTNVELNGAQVSISAPVNVKSALVVNAQSVDANGVVTTTPATVVLSGSAMYADKISINAPTANSSVQVGKAFNAQTGIGIASGGSVSISQPLSSTQGDIAITGTNVGVSNVALAAGEDVNLAGSTITFNQSRIAAGRDINVNATGNINSYAAAGSGSTTVSTPLTKTITDTFNTNFILRIGETFNVSNTGVVTATSQIKAGASLSDALNSLASADPGFKNSDIGFTWVHKEITSLASTTTQNVSSTSFTAVRDVNRTAGGTLYDQATIVQADRNITQTAATIQADAYSTPYSSSTYGTNQTQTLNGGVVWQGWLPGVFLKYNDSVTNTQTNGNGSQQIGVSYTAGGNLSSASTADSSYKANLLSSLGNSAFSGRNITFAPLLSNETQTQTISGLDVTLYGSLGFFGANASGSITGKLGGGNGTMTSGKAATVMAGGNLDANATQNLEFDGSQLTVGGNTTLAAGQAVNFNAIDTTMVINTETATLGAFGGASLGWGGINFELGMNGSLGYANRSQTSQAAGAIKSNGNILISSGADTTLVGTTLASTTGDVSVAAKGAYKHLATTAHTQTGTGGVQGAGSVSFGIGWTGIPNFGFSVQGSANVGSSDVTALTAGSVSAGKNISLASGGDASLQGVSLTAGNQLTLNAGKRLNYDAASSFATGANAVVAGGLGVNVGGTSLGINLNFQGSAAAVNATSQQRGLVKASNVDIRSGGDARFVGTDIRATNAANLSVGGGLSMQSAQVTYLGGSGQATLNLGLGIGLGSSASFTPSFGFKLESAAKSLNTNYNAVLAGQQLNLKVANGVSLSGAVIESPALTKTIGGPVTVTTLTDWAIGGGFNFNFNVGSIATSPALPASDYIGGVSLQAASVPTVVLPWQYTDPQRVNWYGLGANATFNSATGNGIGFGAYVITSPVTQKKSGLFGSYVL
jgi:filamentous hemagglutinin